MNCFQNTNVMLFIFTFSCLFEQPTSHLQKNETRPDEECDGGQAEVPRRPRGLRWCARADVSASPEGRGTHDEGADQHHVRMGGVSF